MGKPTGFIEHARELPGKISADKRVNNYDEFIERYSDKALNQQSARCMNCGIPFCHNACPLGNFIPEFNDAIYRESWKEAYEILTSTNNFPEFTGRICPAPCESACVLGINKPAVVIEEIEKHIIEIAFEKNFVKPRIPRVRTGKKIAVIGSGPAGLAAAAQLNYAGHWVTVYERDDLPGGLLRYGIPDFKLEKKILDRRLKLMEEEGIVFKCSMYVGLTISVDDLLHDYHALVLSGGSTVPRNLEIAGRNLKGIHYAMDFLKQQNKRVSNISFDDEPILASGKNVIVIGGGDTGSDCIGTSNRQKAQSITQFELLPQPPAERNKQMPWPVYPVLLKTTSSHEEGCERKWAITTKEFMGDDKGNLKALKVADVEWTSASNGNSPAFKEIPGSEREIPCGLALLAMGFLHPEKSNLLEELNIEFDQRGNVKTGERDYQTAMPRVFACGDMHRGQSLVVWAISEGRECARNVDSFLMGTSVLETKDDSLLHV